MPLVERIAKGLEESKKTALVFATHKFMGQKELSEMGITYCQLPYAIHRVMGG
jgi:adenine-specific DNA-methyltransferase